MFQSLFNHVSIIVSIMFQSFFNHSSIILSNVHPGQLYSLRVDPVERLTLFFFYINFLNIGTWDGFQRCQLCDQLWFSTKCHQVKVIGDNCSMLFITVFLVLLVCIDMLKWRFHSNATLLFAVLLLQQLRPSHWSNGKSWPARWSHYFFYGKWHDHVTVDCQCHEIVRVPCPRLDVVHEKIKAQWP